MTFCCGPSNDLYLALRKSHFPRYDSPLAALQDAQSGSAVLFLADGYPEQTVRLNSSCLALADQKHLRLFIEYPATLPDLELGASRSTGWERVVVSSDKFGAALPRLRILAVHDCHFIPVGDGARPSVHAPPFEPDLVVARVAGYDTAVFGLPERGVFPILFEIPGRNLIVATTRLSGFVTGRYAPIEDWRLLWQQVLSRLAPKCRLELELKPVVESSYSAAAKLPRGYERKAFSQAAYWFASSHLLVHPSEKEGIHQALLTKAETTAPARPEAPEGDGSLGVLEGYASGIRYDGTQLRRLPLRDDCQAESAMVFALDGLITRRKGSLAIASNLLDFVYFNSGMCQGVRADPQHGAFGLVAWGDIAPAWQVANYGDDNARSILGTALVAASLKSARWDELLLRAVLANFRTAGKLGFRGDRIDLPALSRNGWKTYYEGQTINYAPHYESYLWACYLWAYHHTGFRPFLDRAKTAIMMTMKVYPEQWRWQSNVERARMLLCLAWLVRVQDTVEHRQWLEKVAGDLLADQQPSGAIRERLGQLHAGHFQAARSNEEYGTGETPLLQQNGDPVSDQLYTTGFALLGLHEAVGATRDAKLKQAEDKLAEFLCRIQTRSAKFPWLNGTWFRAFDDRRWEAWASSGDIGWGAWSMESGWGQAWIAAVLALRQMRTTVWDFTAGTHVADHFERLRKQMLPAG